MLRERPGSSPSDRKRFMSARTEEQIEGEIVAMLEAYLDSSTSDGLPILPPTERAVAAFIEHSGLDADVLLGRFRPRETEVTVRDVAINAIMAGCKPQYARVVVATARALMEEAFDVWGVTCSTKGSAPLVIVNGPVRAQIDCNCRGNVFGPGFRANATLGRAVRLMVLNLGGALPNELDKGTLGHPGRYSYCIGEDEEASPWPPLHTERGLRAEDSAVTVFGGESLRLVNVHYNTARAVLDGVVDTLACTGIYNANNLLGRAQHVIVFAKEHRDLLHSEGWTKLSIREYIAANAVIPAADLLRVGGEADGPAAVVQDPNDLLIVAAGGHAGRFAAVIPGWSWQSRAVTKVV
jgi:hypothetical protein